MYQKNELKKWITDTKNEVLDSENNYMFHMVPTETVESLLVILDECVKYIDMIDELKSELSGIRLQDESDPDLTVRQVIEKIERRNKKRGDVDV